VASLAGSAGLGDEEKHRGLGLSAKLLMLTVLFVMLAEVLIFVPSVANFRVNWLTDRLTAARLASLAADAAADHTVPEALGIEMLSVAKVQSVAIKQNDMRRLVLAADTQRDVDRSYDLRGDAGASLAASIIDRFGLIADALSVLVSSGDRTIRVFGHPALAIGASPWSMSDFVEIVLPEAPLRRAVRAFALNILLLSIIISVIAASFVYIALNRLLVRPILRIADNMESFGRQPENASLIISPSGRHDEIGTTERELQQMQRELRSMLNQKNHLAALGLAVSKISHDLRNMLATAQLLSDRLMTAKDPAVQSFAPKLIASLDRAIKLCNDTLQFGRAAETEPRRSMLRLEDLVIEVGEGLALPRAGLDYRIEMEKGLLVDADRDQFYRVLNNLVRNSVQVIEQAAGEVASRPATSGPAASGDHLQNEIVVSARRSGREVTIDVRDSGPGVPQKARANLFRAFQGAARKGGTGLGLAVAFELVTAHGGPRIPVGS